MEQALTNNSKVISSRTVVFRIVVSPLARLRRAAAIIRFETPGSRMQGKSVPDRGRHLNWILEFRYKGLSLPRLR